MSPLAFKPRLRACLITAALGATALVKPSLPKPITSMVLAYRSALAVDTAAPTSAPAVATSIAKPSEPEIHTGGTGMKPAVTATNFLRGHIKKVAPADS